MSVGNSSKPASFTQAFAIDHASAGRAERQADPLAVAHAVVLRRVVPAAVFVAEIFGEVGQRHELVGILVRVVVPAENDVRAGADIGGDRRLRADVLPGFRRERHRHAGRLGEGLGVRLPLVLVALHELVPAQHAELRARLRREAQILRERRSALQKLRTGGADGEAGAGAQKIAS